MLLNAKQFLCSLAILFLAVPIWAAARTDSAEFFTSRPIAVGSTHLKPGDYTLKAEESQKTLDIVRDGKVVASVPCHWIELSKKSDKTEVNQNGNQVVQVQFSGRSEAVQPQ